MRCDIVLGRGEGQRVMQVGLSQAAVLFKKIASYGDPRLYALALVADALSRSTQPLVPERVFLAAPGGEDGKAQVTGGLLGLLVNLLVAEKAGFQMADTAESAKLKDLSDRMTGHVLETMQEDAGSDKPKMEAPTGGASNA